MTTSSRVNTISIALSAMLAVAIFSEPMTPAILTGLILIIAGIIVTQRGLPPNRL